MKVIKDISAFLGVFSFIIALIVGIYLLINGWTPKSVELDGGPFKVRLEPPVTAVIGPTVTPTVAQVTNSAPVIEYIEFPSVIVCDGRRYDALIYFRDLDGNAHRISYELIYSKKQTSFESEAVEFSIGGQSQIQGVAFTDYVEWHTLGDEVRIKVKIEDGMGLTSSKDFEFKCSD